MIKLKDLLEDINLPVNIGDTILVGKFKNKKMIVKKIGTDDHGMPTINGRKATTFRMYIDQTSHREVSIENEAFVKTGAKLKKALYYLKVPIPYITDTDKLIVFLQRNPKILIKLLTILG